MRKKNKILIFGKNGQVGNELQKQLCPIAEVFALDSKECNFTNVQSVRQWIKSIRPNVIINAAAYTSVDKAEQESILAYKINSLAPKIIAEEAIKIDSLLVHYSTDYVFDGRKPTPYCEDDSPNPKSVYGRTKLLGEIFIRKTNCRHLILRTSWVFGIHGNNFTKKILQLAQEKSFINVVTDQRGTPTSSLLIADITMKIIETTLQNPKKEIHGIYHLTSDGSTTWYEYAQYIAAFAQTKGFQLNISLDKIFPVHTSQYPLPAKRPLNSCLETTKIKKHFGVTLPTWQKSVEEVLTVLMKKR